MSRVDFKAAADAALGAADRVLGHWLPGGKIKGTEYQVRNPKRTDNRPGSFSVNSLTGVWSDFATGDSGGDLTSLVAYLDDLSQLEAAKRISDYLGLGPIKQTAKPKESSSQPKKAQWLPIVPVPDEALSSCPTHHPSLGVPTSTWCYLDKEGRLCMRILRFDVVKGGERLKEIRPLIYAKDSDSSQCQWRWQQLPENRPLYRLDQLEAQPSAPVLIVEGEKSADAARMLFRDYVCTTWAGGSKALSKTDWSPLKGRSVYLWPDNDRAGKAGMNELATMLRQIGVTQLHAIQLKSLQCSPGGTEQHPDVSQSGQWPEKSDAADAVQVGWTAAHFQLLSEQGRLWRKLSTAQKAEKPKVNRGQGEQGGSSRFVINENGVFYRNPDEGDDDSPSLSRVCDKLEILARTRDRKGHNWGMLVRFVDPDGNLKEWNIPAELLATEGGAEILRNLYNMGLGAEPGQKPRRRLIEYLQTTQPRDRVQLVNKLGWCDGSFLMPDEVIGDSNERLYFHNPGAQESNIKQSGSLADWRDQIASKCVGNHRLIFAISVAFAAPLLELIGAESSGFHIHGSSSEGKTTLLKLAASVIGGPDYVRTWRSTDNALESTAATHSDCLLVLDEIGQCDPRIIGETIYMLGNGRGKARANDRGLARHNVAEWRLLFLSTGEKTLQEHLAEAGKPIKAGMEMRLLELPSDSGKGLGIFDAIHDFAGGAAFSGYLVERAGKYYGTAFQAFIRQLMEGDWLSKLPSQISTERVRFAADHLSDTASGQARRTADKFALVGLAGDLATTMGITGWPKGAAEIAAVECFNSWLMNRGGEGRIEDKQILQQVGLFFERFGESRFTRWDSETAKVDEHVPRTTDRCGFRKTKVEREHASDESTETVYFVLPEAFKSQVCNGNNTTKIAKLLHELGSLERSSDGKYSVLVRLPGYGSKKQRCYKINPGRLNIEYE